MRLAIDAHTLEIEQWAGKEYYLFSLLQALSRQTEPEIFIYCRKDLPSLKSIFGRRFHFVAKNLKTPLWQIWLLNSLRKNRIDHFLAPCAYLAAAFNVLIPQTVVIHDLTAFLPSVRRTHTWPLRLKEKLTLFLALKNSRNIIAVSESTKNDLIKVFPSQQKKVNLIYQGSRFEILKKNDVIREKSPLILSVGTIEPRKNIPAIVTAFENLKRLKPDIAWRLVIIGKIGWKAASILEMIKKSPFSGEIEIAGYVDDQYLKKYYQQALCLVYPSFYEGFGLPPLEAMSNGCPVIVAGNSSLPETVGKAGIFFNQNKTIEEIILELERNKLWREEHIYKGLEQAKNFSWNKAAQTILRLIQE